jgi:hypothetical protein
MDVKDSWGALVLFMLVSIPCMYPLMKVVFWSLYSVYVADLALCRCGCDPCGRCHQCHNMFCERYRECPGLSLEELSAR